MGIFDKQSPYEKNLHERVEKNLHIIKRRYYEIGEYVKQNYREKTTDTKLLELMRDIDEAQRNIDDLNIEIGRLRDIQICPVCNCEIDYGSEFCPKCGALQEQRRFVYCGKCGSKEKANAKFCTRCGNLMNK